MRSRLRIEWSWNRGVLALCGSDMPARARLLKVCGGASVSQWLGSLPIFSFPVVFLVQLCLFLTSEAVGGILEALDPSK